MSLDEAGGARLFQHGLHRESREAFDWSVRLQREKTVPHHWKVYITSVVPAHCLVAFTPLSRPVSLIDYSSMISLDIEALFRWLRLVSYRHSCLLGRTISDPYGSRGDRTSDGYLVGCWRFLDNGLSQCIVAVDQNRNV